MNPTQRPHEFAALSKISIFVERMDRFFRNHKTFTFEQVLNQAQTWLKGTSFSFAKHDENRLEVRGVRPQKDIWTWIAQIELLEKRIQYLSQFREPVPYQPRLSKEEYVWSNDHDPFVSPKKALWAFYDYVTESGLKFEDHVSYVWPAWHWNGNVEKFLSSMEYIKRVRFDRDCVAGLKE
jgi:hypothetical protein